MTPQERDLITNMLNRLRNTDPGSVDREANDLIRRLTGEIPLAPYLLVQTTLVQDQALTAAHARIQELEQELADTKARQQQPASSTSSFLGGGLFGNWGRRPAAEPPPPPQYQRGPWGAPPPMPQQPYYQQGGGGGGFLQSAMATAAGVAGGALLFEGIGRLMGNSGGAFGASPLSTPPQVVENTTVNNYYGDQSSDSDYADYGDDMDV